MPLTFSSTLLERESHRCRNCCPKSPIAGARLDDAHDAAVGRVRNQWAHAIDQRFGSERQCAVGAGAGRFDGDRSGVSEKRSGEPDRLDRAPRADGEESLDFVARADRDGASNLESQDWRRRSKKLPMLLSRPPLLSEETVSVVGAKSDCGNAAGGVGDGLVGAGREGVVADDGRAGVVVGWR